MCASAPSILYITLKLVHCFFSFTTSFASIPPQIDCLCRTSALSLLCLGSEVVNFV
ncbi:hypothetical protein Hanom_Chr09g00841551 [Helianthus anomalus]